MSTERDLFLTKVELERRRREAAEARQVREANKKHEAAEDATDKPEVNGFAWLRRLAGQG
jgi:hypothetical protein